LTAAQRYELWKKSQADWDDSKFLESLTPLMRRRYERLDAMVYERLKAGIRNPRALLVDVGCGRAEFLEYLEKGPRPSWRYLGVEPSKSQIGQRLVRKPGVGIVRAAGENLPLPDMCADAVLLKEVLDHSWDPYQLLKECYRILRPGGVFVLSVTNDKSYYKRVLPSVNALRKARQHDHLEFFGPEELEVLMRTAPYDQVRLDTYNFLKLPTLLERLLGLLGDGISKAVLAWADRLGGKVMPGMGGGIVLTAHRPGTPSGSTSETPLSDLILCPACGSTLRDKGDAFECTECRRVCAVTDGIPDLLVDDPRGRKG
jgi:SAM-dependent methyltransferase/uncharacterized protein YbaR (Trm112 family)